MRSAWPKLDPGECRHRIKWQQKTVAGQDSFGQDQYEWTEALTVYAKVVPTAGGRESQSAQQRWAEADYQISHAYVSGVREDWRILWIDGDGVERYLDVLNIDDRDGKRMVLDILAKEWVS